MTTIEGLEQIMRKLTAAVTFSGQSESRVPSRKVLSNVN